MKYRIMKFYHNYYNIMEINLLVSNGFLYENYLYPTLVKCLLKNWTFIWNYYIKTHKNINKNTNSFIVIKTTEGKSTVKVQCHPQVEWHWYCYWLPKVAVYNYLSCTWGLDIDISPILEIKFKISVFIKYDQEHWHRSTHDASLECWPKFTQEQ